MRSGLRSALGGATCTLPPEDGGAPGTPDKPPLVVAAPPNIDGADNDADEEEGKGGNGRPVCGTFTA